MFIPCHLHLCAILKVCLPCFLSTAWSVSLNPKGGTYAATGGSGNVTIHSAEPETFGEQRTFLQSGRGKFGMRCSHVGISSASSLETWLMPYRVPMALALHYPLTVVRSSCLTLRQAPSHPRTHHMLWLFARCRGPLIRRFVSHAYIAHVAEPRRSFSSQLPRTSALSCTTCAQRHPAGRVLGRWPRFLGTPRGS